MAEHSRRKHAREILRRSGYAVGGHLAHPDEAQDRALISKMLSEHGAKKAKPRLKDGGCASGGMPPVRGDHKPRGHKGGKGHKTVVNVLVGRGEKPAPMPIPIPVGGGAGGPAPMPPPSRVPVPVPMGAGPSGPQFKKGGKVKRANGGSPMRDPIEALKPTGGTKLKGGGRAKFAVPMEAGAGGGKGRLEKIKDYGAKV